MAKKKNQNRKEKFEKKSAIESLKFLTHYGLRQMAYEDGDMFHGLESGGIWEKLFSKRVANQDKSVYLCVRRRFSTLHIFTMKAMYADIVLPRLWGTAAPAGAAGACL